MPRKTAYKTKKRSKSRQASGFAWKKSGKRSTSGFKSFFSGFMVFAFASTFLAGVYFYRVITKPLVSADSASSQDLITKENTTIALIEVSNLTDENYLIEKLHIVLFDKKDSLIRDMEFPVSTEVDVAGKYGTEELSKVLALGASVRDDNVEEGVSVLIDTLEKVIAYKIDYYILVDSNTSEAALSSLTTGSVMDAGILLKDSLFNGSSNSVTTNMSINVLNSYREFAASLDIDAFKKVEMQTPDSSVIDSTISDITFDSIIAQEKKSIAVLNGTNTPGLASFGSRVVKNMGGRVIAVENTRKAYDSSILVVDDTMSESAKELSRFFNVDTVLLKSEASSIKENEISRSDITLILGFDIGNNL